MAVGAVDVPPAERELDVVAARVVVFVAVVVFRAAGLVVAGFAAAFVVVRAAAELLGEALAEYTCVVVAPDDGAEGTEADADAAREACLL